MAEREQIQQALRQQVMVQIYSEVIKKSSQACFDQCVSRPTSSLSSRDFGCLGRCTDRYLEAFAVVADAYAKKAEEPSSDAMNMAVNDASF